MTDDVYVLNEGQNIPDDFTTAPTNGTFNLKTSVNPRAMSINVENSDVLGIYCYEIHSADKNFLSSGTVGGSVVNRLYPQSTTVSNNAENIIENPGYRITIDTGNANGLTESQSSVDYLLGDTTLYKDYFVLIYADDFKKHHIGKITEQIQYDGTNYHFEFTPRLKENIPVGTKVAIYQGPTVRDPAITHTTVAVGYGLLNDPDPSSGTNNTDERHDKYVDISRPTFYFYEGDKLDHDRKYSLLKLSSNFTPSTPEKSVFKTAPLSSDMIIDKSFFTHHGDLTDNNRANDNLPVLDSSNSPRDINAQASQGSTYTFNRETWAGSSKNIYDSDGGLSTYITFIDSPVNNQIHSSPYYVNVNKTVTNKGNMATIKFFDVEKILDKKINTYERFKVKQFITEKKLDRIASSALPGTCTNTTSTTFTVSGLVAGEDWRKVLYDGSSAYEPVFIENYYYVISGITAPADGEQVVTVTHKRLLTANAFSSVGTLETFSGKKAYRKTWSPVSQTFLADHQIDTQIDFANAITRNGITVTASDSDVNGIEYILEDSRDSVILEVDKGDKDTGYTKITSRPASNFFSGKYLTDSITGKLVVNNPIFEGFVETKKADVKQAFKYEIVGRDSISKILNTSLDKNYVHSEEFVYTTFNPFVGDITNAKEFVDTTINIQNTSGISGKVITTNTDARTFVQYGDTLAIKIDSDRYITLGVVKSVSSTEITLMKDSYIENLTNVGSSTVNLDLYKIRKSIIPHKNMETTPRITNRATSIAGTLDKGIVFNSGNSFNSAGEKIPLSFGEPISIVLVGDINSSNIVLENLYEDKSLRVGDLISHPNYPLGTKINTISNGTIVPSNSPTTTASSQNIVFTTSVKNGFDIENFVTPVVNSSGGYLDFPLGFQSSIDIAASTPELNIVSSENNLDGTVNYELGYVSPIVLGMVTKNSNDYFTDTTEVINQPIRLINGQGLPDGGFLHLLSNEKNSDKSPKTFNNIISDDPAYGSTVTSQYALRYNQPIFRYANMAKVLNQLVLQPFSYKMYNANTSRFNSDTHTASFYSRNDYYENTKNFNFYMSTYKLTQKSIDFDKDNSSKWLKGLPKEQTGILPALGSRFFDITRVPTWYYNSGVYFGNRFSPTSTFDSLDKFVGKLELHDPSAISLHLFSLGDIHPESKTNENNMFYTGRDLNDYSLIFKRSKTENNENDNVGYDNFIDFNSPLKLNISSRQDGDYHSEPITNSNGDKIRFNIMRLTDLTLDMLFNDVDYENYKTGNNMKELSQVALKGSSTGINPQILIKSFPQAGLHNVDVKVTSVQGSADKLNISTGKWNSFSTFTHYLYYYASGQDWPTLIGKVSTVVNSNVTKPSIISTGPSLITVTNNTGIEVGDTIISPHFPEDTLVSSINGILITPNKAPLSTASSVDVIFSKAEVTFTEPIPTTALTSNVVGTTLYVQTYIDDIDATNKKTTMLLTKDSVVPYFPESTIDINHNYNKTVFLTNSRMELDNSSSADDLFNSDIDSSSSASDGNITLRDDSDYDVSSPDDYSARSAILRVPIFKSRIFDGYGSDSTKLIHTRKTNTNDQFTSTGQFRMTIMASVTGNTITASQSESKFTHFFDNHIETKIGVSHHNQSLQTILNGGVSIRGDNNNEFVVTDTSDLKCGTVINFSGSEYIVTKINSGTRFTVYPNHNSTSTLSTFDDGSTYAYVRDGIYEATGTDQFFIEVSGLTDSEDNRLYKVTGVTDTVLTITDMAGQNPSMATENDVEITITSFNPSGSPITGHVIDDYATNFSSDFNGQTEPDIYSRFLNNVIPHRAYHDSELAIDYGNLDVVVAKFYDIPEMFPLYKMLPEEIKQIRGANFAVNGASGDRGKLLRINHKFKGSDSSALVRWNKSVWIHYANQKGIMSENYNAGATQYAEKAYAGEIFFRPFIKYATTMSLTDSTLDSSEKVLKFDINTTPFTTNKQIWLNYCNNLTGCYFYNENNSTLHKVISHEINRNESNVLRHLIKIDNASGINADDILRPMRINQVCMYDFSPNTIQLNRPKLEYTKVCGEDRMQTEGFDATRINAADNGEGMIMDQSNEGVKSMYVMIEPDGNINNNYLETRTSSEAEYSVLENLKPVRMNVTDGITSYPISFTRTGTSVYEMSEVRKILGTPSFGSTFTVTVNKSPNFKPETACIGASFKIVDEIEKVIDDALNINDIDYTQDTDDDKYYGAFNFTGQSIYSAANNLLSYKDKEILVDGEEIKIVDKEDEKKYRNIVLSSKNSDFQITSINNDVSLLDNFDEVIVIGDGVKGIARNPISTTDTGRTVKTREIYDYSILDKRQADLKAIQYLDVFNTANTSIEIEVADNVPFLKPGHIIELEFEEQNIPRGDYLVIETEKEFGRPTKFILSEYSKDLAGTFSLLLGEIRNLQGFTKQKVYTSTTIPRIKRDKVNIKFVKSTATSTISTVTSTIGFGYTIGFDSEVGV